MTTHIPKSPSPAGRVRAFMATQLTLVVVAAALFAILWVTGVRGLGAGFAPILLYSLFIGNFTTPMMNRLEPLSSRLRFPWDWVAYLIFLFLTAALIASPPVFVAMALYRIPMTSYFTQLWSAGRLVVVVVLIVGSIRHLHEKSRVHLEGKNLKLQRAVAMGNTRSKQQAQAL